MPPFFHLIRDICLLRRGPQDLPYSVPLLLAVAGAWVMLQLGVALAREISLSGVLAGAVLWLMFTLGALNLVLTLRSLRNRFVQAATALLGCALAFTLLRLPIALLFGDPPIAGEKITTLQLILSLISLPLLVWEVVVNGHVFRHTLDIPFLSGIVVALLWIIGAVALASVAGAPGP